MHTTEEESITRSCITKNLSYNHMDSFVSKTKRKIGSVIADFNSLTSTSKHFILFDQSDLRFLLWVFH